MHAATICRITPSLPVGKCTLTPVFIAQLGKGDLSDWVELMEAVEALCPVWPARVPGNGNVYKL
jgi:hypothetical protein